MVELVDTLALGASTLVVWRFESSSRYQSSSKFKVKSINFNLCFFYLEKRTRSLSRRMTGSPLPGTIL